MMMPVTMMVMAMMSVRIVMIMTTTKVMAVLHDDGDDDGAAGADVIACFSEWLLRHLQEIQAKAAFWQAKIASDIEAKDAELKALVAEREEHLERLKKLQDDFDRDVAAQASKEVCGFRKHAVPGLRAVQPQPSVVAAVAVAAGLHVLLLCAPCCARRAPIALCCSGALGVWQAEELRKIELARQKAIDDEKKRQAATLLQRVLGTAFKLMLEAAAAKKGAGKKGKGGKKGKK